MAAMPSARRNVMKNWWLPFRIAGWASILGVTVLAVVFFAAVSARLWTEVTDRGSAPTAAASRTAIADCGPTSVTPCSEREARLQLQAVNDIAYFKVNPTAGKMILEAEIAKARAEVEMEKAQWLQQQYSRQAPPPSASSQKLPETIPCELVPDICRRLR
jgi:hypothetical protein